MKLLESTSVSSAINNCFKNSSVFGLGYDSQNNPDNLKVELKELIKEYKAAFHNENTEGNDEIESENRKGATSDPNIYTIDGNENEHAKEADYNSNDENENLRDDYHDEDETGDLKDSAVENDDDNLTEADSLKQDEKADSEAELNKENQTADDEYEIRDQNDFAVGENQGDPADDTSEDGKLTQETLRRAAKNYFAKSVLILFKTVQTGKLFNPM